MLQAPYNAFLYRKTQILKNDFQNLFQLHAFGQKKRRVPEIEFPISASNQLIFAKLCGAVITGGYIHTCEKIRDIIAIGGKILKKSFDNIGSFTFSICVNSSKIKVECKKLNFNFYKNLCIMKYNLVTNLMEVNNDKNNHR